MTSSVSLLHNIELLKLLHFWGIQMLEAASSLRESAKLSFNLGVGYRDDLGLYGCLLWTLDSRLWVVRFPWNPLAFPFQMKRSVRVHFESQTLRCSDHPGFPFPKLPIRVESDPSFVSRRFGIRLIQRRPQNPGYLVTGSSSWPDTD